MDLDNLFRIGETEARAALAARVLSCSMGIPFIAVLLAPHKYSHADNA
jgi:hypothetical protein